MLKLNLKIALRNLWKNTGYTIINVGGLAIGLASCMILLLYVAYEWAYDKQFTNYQHTYVVYNNQQANGKVFSFNATPGIMAETVKAQMPGVKWVTRTSYPEDYLLTFNTNSFKKKSLYADPEFLKIFDFKVLEGNPATFLKHPNSIILTKTFAATLFGKDDPINKTVKLDNSTELKVEGIIADVPKNSTIQFEYILPWSLYDKFNPWTKDVKWDSNYCITFVQLHDNSHFDKTNQQFHRLIKENNNRANGEPFLHPLEKWHLYDSFEGGKSIGGKIQQLQIFFMLAFCILLIACVNFMNLSTARSEKRAKEVGVRKAVGSSRKDLILQFMMESILLSFISMLVAFMLIELALPYFNNILGIELRIDYTALRFWAVLFGLTLLTGLIAGSYPAFYLSSFEPTKVLKGATNGDHSSLSIRKILVVFQFLFATCLIICTTVIYQQLNYIKHKSIGYDKNNLIEIPVQGELGKPAKFRILKEELLQSGYVTAVSNLSTPITSGGNNGYGVSWPGKDINDRVLVNFRWTGYDYIKTTAINMIMGRDFSRQHQDSSSVLVNEALVKTMGIKQPVGSVIKWGDSPVTIIGVIQDYVVESPYHHADPMIIGLTSDVNSTILIRVAPNKNLSAAVQVIDDKVKALNPAFPVDRKFVDDNFEAKFSNEKLLGTLANWFGGFSIFISCLGLLGLALYMAEQRKKEISIRKVLGASSLDILLLLNRDFIKLVVIANVIAFPLGYVIVSQWLAHYDYRVSISIVPFAMALMLSLLIAVLTVSLQSFKVAKANPIDALKYE